MTVRLGLDGSAKGSGGVEAFLDRLSRALDGHEGVEQLVVAGGDGAVGIGVDELDDATIEQHRLDAVIFPGNRGRSIDGSATSILWPLSVAPAEPFALGELFPGPIGRAKQALLPIKVRRSMAKADALIYSSNYARSVLAGLHPEAARRPTLVVQPAATVNEISWTGGRTTDPYVLWVSHGYPTKLAVEAVEGYGRHAATVSDPPRMIMAGSWPIRWYHEQVIEAIAALPAGSVTLVGHQSGDQLRELYNDAACFLFTSCAENAGSYALLDAMAGGVPVVSSAMSSMPEICHDSVLYADPLQPEAIADALGRLLSDASLRSDLAARAIERSKHFPQWSDIADDVVAFVERIGSP